MKLAPAASGSPSTPMPHVSASVTTTVMLPAEALTVVAPPPEMISQLNVEHVLGIPARAYLELLREAGCPLEVIRVGKLRLVARAPFVAWLRTRPIAATSAAANDAATTEADDALDEFNLKPAPRAQGRRRR